jgi:hypothetical protein
MTVGSWTNGCRAIRQGFGVFQAQTRHEKLKMRNAGEVSRSV